jgi:hypothetical protein
VCVCVCVCVCAPSQRLSSQESQTQDSNALFALNQWLTKHADPAIMRNSVLCCDTPLGALFFLSARNPRLSELDLPVPAAPDAHTMHLVAIFVPHGVLPPLPSVAATPHAGLTPRISSTPRVPRAQSHPRPGLPVAGVTGPVSSEDTGLLDISYEPVADAAQLISPPPTNTTLNAPHEDVPPPLISTRELDDPNSFLPPLRSSRHSLK